MVTCLTRLEELTGRFDAIVLDQWGVLHDGKTAFQGVRQAIRTLRAIGTRFAVLSNSGKRAAPNAARIAAMGLPEDLFEQIMTSGEALWRDFAQRGGKRTLIAIERDRGDAQTWADGLDVSLVEDVDQAEAVLLMGLPDGVAPDAFDPLLEKALTANLPVYCSNPDFASPRADGGLVISPGALAQRYSERGGTVHLYGKPHLPVFKSLEKAMNVAPERLLMVGDSLHHDILGAQRAGWKTLLIRAGVHAASFNGVAICPAIKTLAEEASADTPDFCMERLA